MRAARCALLGAIAGLTLLGQSSVATAQPIDVRVARWSQQPALQNSIALDRTLATMEWIAIPGGVALPALTFAGARLARRDVLSESALRVEASVLVAAGITHAMKRVIGRARPYAVGDSVANDFAIGTRIRAGSDYRSFPSGHATAAFSTATAVILETRRTAPRHSAVITPVAYSLATLAGLGRIYHDKHWASDVLAGAIIGTLTAHGMQKIPPKRRQ